MKKLLLSVLILLCFASFAEAQGCITVSKKKAAACDSATNEVGYESNPRTGHTGDMNVSSNEMDCVLYAADCSGTLGYGYAFHQGTSSATAKICVYTDNGATANQPDSTDTMLSSSTCSALSSNTNDEWAKTAGKLGGSVVNGTKYWLCIVASASATWVQGFNSSGNNTIYSNGSSSYTSPPANLDGFSVETTTAILSIYVEIE
jgi:hypothetical protein